MVYTVLGRLMFNFFYTQIFNLFTDVSVLILYLTYGKPRLSYFDSKNLSLLSQVVFEVFRVKVRKVVETIIFTICFKRCLFQKLHVKY